MKKIAITGSGGAGKSTLACQIGLSLKIDVIHLDKIFWHPGWIPTSQLERKKLLDNILHQDRWILEGDGDYSSRKLTYDLRFAAADTIIWLDLPRSRCLWQVFKRCLEYRGKCRPDLPVGCQEYWRSQGFLNFLNRVWNFPSAERPLVAQKIHAYSQNKKIIVLRSFTEVENFLSQLNQQNSLKRSLALNPPKLNKIPAYLQ